MSKVILFLFSLLIYLSCNSNYCEKSFNRLKLREVKGVLFIKDNLGDRNGPRLYVKNYYKIDNISPYMYDTFSVNNLWKCVEIGDSIYKPAKSLEFTVFKQNADTLKCRYDCDYWNEKNL